MLISFMRSYGSINLNMMAISNPAFDANRRFPPEVFLPGVCAADGSLLRGEQTRQTHHLLEFLTGERVPALFSIDNRFGQISRPFQPRPFRLTCFFVSPRALPPATLLDLEGDFGPRCSISVCGSPSAGVRISSSAIDYPLLLHDLLCHL